MLVHFCVGFHMFHICLDKCIRLNYIFITHGSELHCGLNRENLCNTSSLSSHSSDFLRFPSCTHPGQEQCSFSSE